MPVQRTLNKDFFKTWSSEMAYVLGYFAADGCMILNGRNSHYIEFTSTDKILIDIVQKAIVSNHKVSLRRRGGNTKDAYRLQIGSKTWYEDLSSLGFISNKSNVMVFPSVPIKYLGHFARGYFDGDGCVYFKSHFAKDRNKNRWIFQTLFTSGSYSFLYSLLQELRHFGLYGGRISPKNKSGYDMVFSWKDSVALYHLMYHTAQVGTMFLPRKRQKFELALEVLSLDK